jgi:hypothetical protein
MTVIIDGNELVIRLPYDSEGVLSASGKSRVVATTRGNQESELVVDGKHVVVGVNAYVPVR